MLDIVISQIGKNNINVVSLGITISYLFIFELINETIVRIYMHTKQNIDLISTPLIRIKYYEQLKYLGIQTLEKPEINDKMNRSQEVLGSVYNHLESFIKIIAKVVSVVVSAFILFNFLPYYVFYILIAAVPNYLVDKKFRKKVWDLIFQTSQKRRIARESAYILSDSHTLPEILINNSFKFLSTKFEEYFIWFTKLRLDLQKKWSIAGFLLFGTGDLVVYSGYFYVFINLIKKSISIGTSTFQIKILQNFQNSVTSVMQQYNHLAEMSLRLKDTYTLFQAKPDIGDGSIHMDILTKGPEIKIENLSFKYLRSDKNIFNNLNLHIKSNEKVAIVGHNGAGKTTLVKLLVRFYAPQKGKILINSIDLKDIKVEDWYKNTGVLFQDYNRYPHLSAKENIYIGKPDEVLDNSKLDGAILSADARLFIDELAEGYETLLDTKYNKGTRPSTGQWQKLAIARFFYRNSPLVIFDEPTAAIDAVAEYKIFNKIYSFFNNKTVIIISHRFSTVRNADRIIVLDHGQIVEEGTHDQLMQKEGYYNRAFLLQAQGYTTSIV